jgi:hypothetical protein
MAIFGVAVFCRIVSGRRVSHALPLSRVTIVQVPGRLTVQSDLVLKSPGGVTELQPGHRTVNVTGPLFGTWRLFVELALMICSVAILRALQPSVKFSGLTTLNVGKPWLDVTLKFVHVIQPFSSFTAQCV